MEEIQESQIYRKPPPPYDCDPALMEHYRQCVQGLLDFNRKLPLTGHRVFSGEILTGIKALLHPGNLVKVEGSQWFNALMDSVVRVSTVSYTSKDIMRFYVQMRIIGAHLLTLILISKEHESGVILYLPNIEHYQGVINMYNRTPAHKLTAPWYTLLSNSIPRLRSDDVY